jgi:hypothetical protein
VPHLLIMTCRRCRRATSRAIHMLGPYYINHTVSHNSAAQVRCTQSITHDCRLSGSGSADKIAVKGIVCTCTTTREYSTPSHLHDWRLGININVRLYSKCILDLQRGGHILMTYPRRIQIFLTVTIEHFSRLRVRLRLRAAINW